MSKISDFLQACGTFYVFTINDDFPAGRPFGAVMEHNGMLYISTANTKAVYRQILLHPNIQMLALKAGTRDWIRINGTANRCEDLSLKQKCWIRFQFC